MGIGAVGAFKVKRDSCIKRKGSHELFGKAVIEFACSGVIEAAFKNKERSVADIKAAEAKALVHGDKACAVPCNALHIAHSLLECHTKHNTCVLNGMMTVNIKVAFDRNVHIKATVNAKSSEHMVKKSYSRINIMNALSVKVKLNGYLGLLCISCYFGNAHMIFPFVSKLRKNFPECCQKQLVFTFRSRCYPEIASHIADGDASFQKLIIDLLCL